jgi:hypothetical protein
MEALEHCSDVVRAMRGDSPGSDAPKAGAHEYRQQLSHNLRRAFPLVGRGEFDDLLAALQQVSSKTV